ncbi:MAG: prepilin peptidase [Candidatus Hodarchaeota archaeon]
MIEILSIILLFVFLGISSYQDWKTREVTDWVWVTLLIMGLVINVIIILSTRNWVQTLSKIALSTIIATSIGFILFYLYLWGGGDLLVYIAASFVSATLPIPLHSPKSFEILPFSFSALTNAYLLTALLPGYLLLENTYRRFLKGEQIFEGLNASTRHKLFAALVGRPIRPETLWLNPSSFYTVVEEKNENIWNLNFHSGMKFQDEALDAQKQLILQEVRNDHKQYVWISYNLPFLLPLTIGFLITTIYGTLLLHMWYLLRAL